MFSFFNCTLHSVSIFCPTPLILSSSGFWKQMDIADSQLLLENIPNGFNHGYNLYIYIVILCILYAAYLAFQTKESPDSIQKLPVGNTRESPFFKLIIPLYFFSFSVSRRPSCRALPWTIWVNWFYTCILLQLIVVIMECFSVMSLKSESTPNELKSK